MKAAPSYRSASTSWCMAAERRFNWSTLSPAFFMLFPVRDAFLAWLPDLGGLLWGLNFGVFFTSIPPSAAGGRNQGFEKSMDRPRAISLQLSALSANLKNFFAFCREVTDKDSTLVRGEVPEREPFQGRSYQRSAVGFPIRFMRVIQKIASTIFCRYDRTKCLIQNSRAEHGPDNLPFVSRNNFSLAV